MIEAFLTHRTHFVVHFCRALFKHLIAVVINIIISVCAWDWSHGSQMTFCYLYNYNCTFEWIICLSQFFNEV